MRTKERGAIVKRPAMSPIPRRLFLIYTLISAVTFGISYFFPAARVLSPAPLQSVALPAPEPVVVNVLYSTEKEGWLRDVLAAFEATRPLVNGRPVRVYLQTAGSRDIYLDTLKVYTDVMSRRDRDALLKPDLVSPASRLHLALLEEHTQKTPGGPVIRLSDPEQCRVIVRTPLVMAVDRERVDALLRGEPKEQVWSKIYARVVAAEPAKDVTDEVKFSHADPTTSNSGLLTLLALAHTYVTTQRGQAPGYQVTAQDIDDPAFQAWLQAFEARLARPDYNERLAMEGLARSRPARYDAITTYEATAIQQLLSDGANGNKITVFYPPRTVWSDHPFCLMNAPWVSGEKAEAARLFLNFLSSGPALELALHRYGFRPTASSPSLDSRDSPFTRLIDSGLQLTLPPDQKLPAAAVAHSLVDRWASEVAPLKR